MNEYWNQEAKTLSHFCYDNDDDDDDDDDDDELDQIVYAEKTSSLLTRKKSPSFKAGNNKKGNKAKNDDSNLTKVPSKRDGDNITNDNIINSNIRSDDNDRKKSRIMRKNIMTLDTTVSMDDYYDAFLGDNSLRATSSEQQGSNTLIGTEDSLQCNKDRNGESQEPRELSFRSASTQPVNDYNHDDQNDPIIHLQSRKKNTNQLMDRRNNNSNNTLEKSRRNKDDDIFLTRGAGLGKTNIELKRKQRSKNTSEKDDEQKKDSRLYQVIDRPMHWGGSNHSRKEKDNTNKRKRHNTMSQSQAQSSHQHSDSHNRRANLNKNPKKNVNSTLTQSRMTQNSVLRRKSNTTSDFNPNQLNFTPSWLSTKESSASENVVREKIMRDEISNYDDKEAWDNNNADNDMRGNIGSSNFDINDKAKSESFCLSNKTPSKSGSRRSNNVNGTLSKMLSKIRTRVAGDAVTLQRGIHPFQWPPSSIKNVADPRTRASRFCDITIVDELKHNHGVQMSKTSIANFFFQAKCFIHEIGVLEPRESIMKNANDVEGHVKDENNQKSKRVMGYFGLQNDDLESVSIEKSLSLRHAIIFFKLDKKRFMKLQNGSKVRIYDPVAWLSQVPNDTSPAMSFNPGCQSESTEVVGDTIQENSLFLFCTQMCEAYPEAVVGPLIYPVQKNCLL